MRKEFVASALGMLLFAAGSARADFLYTFNTPTGTLGSSQDYTVSGLKITARGYTNGGSALNLYGKNDSGDEKGLGISSTTDHEIETSNFIQLDLTNLFNALNVTSLQIKFGSVTPPDGYKVYGSNTLGSKGSFLFSGTQDLTWLDVPDLTGQYKYISVTASAGDLLIYQLDAAGTAKEPPPSAPEPASFVLFGIGAVGLLGFARRQRRATALKLA